MAYGDIGGVENWQTVTMKTPGSGSVSIAKGDAVKLVGGFEVSNSFTAEDVVIGQALADASTNGKPIPVMIAGIAKLRFTGISPLVNGQAGVLASGTSGKVKKPASGNGVGRNLKVEVTSQTLTLATVVAGDSVTINGLTFTAHASTTTPSSRQFSIAGTDAADASELASVINHATYGVPGVTATVSSNVVTVTAKDLDNTTVTVTNPASTITVAVNGGNVWMLL